MYCCVHLSIYAGVNACAWFQSCCARLCPSVIFDITKHIVADVLLHITVFMMQVDCVSQAASAMVVHLSV